MAIIQKTISIFSLRDEIDNLISGVPVYINNIDGSLADIYHSTSTNDVQSNPVYTDSFGQVSIWADESQEYTAEIISDAPKNTGLYARIDGGWELFAVRSYIVECGEEVECGEGGECGDYTDIIKI